jgi:hypothetical protein
MHHALVMIWLFVLLKPFSNGVGVGGTTAPKATQGDFLGVLVDRSGFRDGPVIGVRGLPSILPFPNALAFVDHPQVAGNRETCIHCGVCIWNCMHLDEDPAPSNIAFSAGAGGLHSTEN